jgi:putative protease
MEIIALPKNLTEITKLKELGIKTLLFESDRFSRTAVMPLEEQNLTRAIKITKKAGMKAYVRLNTIVGESDLADLECFLARLASEDPDGIVFYDLTIGVILESLCQGHKGIYQPGTFNTHTDSLIFLKNLGISKATISKEISFQKIQSIIDNNPGFELSLIGHGFIDCFYSKRPLLSLFAEYKGFQYNQDAIYHISEKSRPGELYPISEDRAGTHIHRPKKLHSFAQLAYLKNHIQALFVERYRIADCEYYEAIKAYHSGDYEAFLQEYGNEYDNSILNQETRLRKALL